MAGIIYNGAAVVSAAVGPTPLTGVSVGSVTLWPSGGSGGPDGTGQADDWVDAIEFQLTNGEYISDQADNTAATTESGEPLVPAEYDTGKTLWWKFTPAETRDYMIDTALSTGDTELGVFTGESVDALTLVAGNSDDGDPDYYTSVVPVVTLTAGVTYYIQVGGYEGEAINNIRLRVRTVELSDAPVRTGTVSGVSSFTLPEAREDDFVAVVWTYTSTSPEPLGPYSRLTDNSRATWLDAVTGYYVCYADGQHDGGSLTYDFGDTVHQATWLQVPARFLGGQWMEFQWTTGEGADFDTIDLFIDEGPYAVSSQREYNVLAALWASRDSGSGMVTGSYYEPLRLPGGSGSVDVSIPNAAVAVDANSKWACGALVVTVEPTPTS